jgi:hypothetical protein
LHWRRDNAVDRDRWFLNTRVDRYCGTGRFLPGGQDQLVVMGPRGFGIVPVGAEEHLTTAVDGQRLGSWTLDLARDRVVAVAASMATTRTRSFWSDPAAPACTNCAMGR